MVTHADLYRMVLCCPAMGCTVEALEVPRKMLAISIAPHNAATPSGDVLHSTHNKPLMVIALSMQWQRRCR